MFSIYTITCINPIQPSIFHVFKACFITKAHFITTSPGLLSMGAGMLLKKLEEAPVTPPGERPTHDVELGSHGSHGKCHNTLGVKPDERVTTTFKIISNLVEI